MRFNKKYSQPPSSKELTEEFGIDARDFHTVGNDANFTLKVLLMLAVNGCEPQDETMSKAHLEGELEFTEDQAKTREKLKAIALAPVPDTYGNRVDEKRRNSLIEWIGAEEEGCMSLEDIVLHW